MLENLLFFFFSSRRRHTRWNCDWSSDVCSSDLDELRVEQGLTVIAAMHELTLAGQYADRIALLVGGQLVAVGAPSEVLTKTAIASHYHAHVQVLSMNGS